MRERILSAMVMAGLIGAAGISPMALADGHKNTAVQGAVDFRESTMTIYKWYLQPMGGMVKGKVPFNKEVFKQKADGLAWAASLNLLEGFPKGSMHDTEAKAEIWERWDDFQAKYETLKTESAKLQQVAAGGDVAAIKAQFAQTAKSCKGCHQAFREK